MCLCFPNTPALSARIPTRSCLRDIFADCERRATPFGLVVGSLSAQYVRSSLTSLPSHSAATAEYLATCLLFISQSINTSIRLGVRAWLGDLRREVKVYIVEVQLDAH